MRQKLFKDAVILGLLTAIGPFAIDMYLPAMPEIGRSLAATPEQVVMSLTVFFIPFALLQIVYGPVSDAFGRRAPLAFGIGLFAIASVGCALATDIGTLLAFRALQGAGAAAPIVIPMAIVRDMHTGVEAARLSSLLMLVFGTSPILAPLAGSLAISFASWRVVFWAVTVAAILGLVLLATMLAETRPKEARHNSGVSGTLAAFRLLLADRHFMAMTMVGGIAMASFFVYLANSSFILIDHYGLSPAGYSLAFSSNAFAFFAAAQLNGWLGGRFGLHRIVRPAVYGYAMAMFLAFGLTLAGVENLVVIGVVLALGYGFLGIVLPVTTVLALEEHGSIAGAASSLLGTLRLLLGAVIIAVSSRFSDGTLLPMAAGIAACAAVTLALALAMARSAARTAQA
jgi:DHA1 family bicyclomycin/chloramphenicol resistance-like MFS transporter